MVLKRSVARAGRQLLAAAWLLALSLAAFLYRETISDLDLAQLNQPPSLTHWLGTDPYGRDVLADLLAGTRSLLLVSVPAAGLASLLGMALGAAAGYWGDHGYTIRRSVAAVLLLGTAGALLTAPPALPWWGLGTALAAAGAGRLPLLARPLALPLDRLLLAAAGFLGAVPRLVLALVLAAVRAPSAGWLLLILTLSCWPTPARLARTLVRQLRPQSFIEAGRAAGYSDRRLLFRHLLPNAWPSLRATLPLNLSVCLGLQTTLSFLGLGLPPDQADWGRTLANARLEPGAWWITGSTLLALLFTLTALHQLLPRSPAINPD